jgi:hypothetical protein
MQNKHWLYLNSSKTDLQVALQHTLATISTFVLPMTHLLAFVLTIEDVANTDDIDYDALNMAFESIPSYSWLFSACYILSKFPKASSLTS